MKKLKSIIGVLITSGIFGSIAGGAMHFKYAKLTPALMVGGVVFMLLTGLGLSIINEETEIKK